MQNKERPKTFYIALFAVWLKNKILMGKWIKRWCVLFFNFIMIGWIFVVLLIYSSVVQTLVAKFLTQYLSDDMGLEVKIDKVSVDIFHKVHLHGLLIKDEKKDTMIYLKNLNVDIQYSSIFHNKLIIRKIQLENPVINMVRHKGDKRFNYEKLINYFSSADTTTNKDATSFDLKIKNIELKEAQLIYKDEKYNTQISEQLNYDFLKLTHLNVRLENPHQKQDTFYVSVKQLSATEQSGLVLKKFTSHIRITPQSLFLKGLFVQTPQSLLNGDVLLTYPSFDEWIEDPEKNMTIYAHLNTSTKIHFTDLYHFAKELKGWNNYVEFSGKVEGKIGDMHLTDAHLNYAGTQINGDIKMKGLPDIEKTFFKIKARSMHTCVSCIQQIPLYPFDKNEFISFPKPFKNIGLVTFRGDIEGFYHQFKITGTLVTEIGNLTLHTTLQIDSISKDLKYNGEFSFYNFHLGKFFQKKNIGPLTANVFLNGQGTNFHNLNTSIQTHIKKFVLNNYTYQNIRIDVNWNKKQFTGDLSSSDENAQLLLSGQINFDTLIPNMNFAASIDKLNLNQLHLLNNVKNGTLSGTATIKLSGENIDDVSGDIRLNNIQYSTKDKIYYFSNSQMKLNQDHNHPKTFYFHSDFFDIDIQGRFQLSNANDYLHHFMNTFYPSFVKEKHTYKEIRQDTFQLVLNIKNFEPISELLTKHQIFIQPNTQLKIKYHPKEQELRIYAHSDKIVYGKYVFTNNQFDLNSKGQQLNALFKIDKIKLSDSLYLNNVSVCTHSKDKQTKTNIEWQTIRDSTIYTYNGQIGFSALFYPHAVYIIPDVFEIPVGKDKWTATTLNPIIIDTSGNIDFFPLELTRQSQSLRIEGFLHNREKDELRISFNQLALHQLNPLLADFSIQLKGTLNGQLIVHQSLKPFILSSNIHIQNFYLNHHFIGNIHTHTMYQPFNKSLFMQGYLSYDYSKIMDIENNTQLKYLNFEGSYYTDKKDSSLNIKIEAKPFNLAILNPILKDIMTIDYAFLYGKGTITGTPDKPLISGNFKMTDSKIKTDFLNTYHKITGNIEVMPNQIRFDEMNIYNYGNKELAGFLNGNIFHDNFSNIRLDFDISAKNLMVLNTNPTIHKEYYGNIYASGTIGIYGFINNMNIEANLTPQKHSKFILSFSHPEEVGENSFVRFINPKDTIIKKKKNNTLSGLQMKFILNTTSDLETEVVLNDKTGDGVKARGDGVIEMNINSFGNFEIKGEYTIHSGTYLFTLESILNKKFEIEDGSKITFVGNPYNTLLNVHANYIQKASLAPLFPYDSSGTFKRRYPVHAQLSIKGKLIAPEIFFNISVPQTDAATQSKIQLLLSDENELNRQFFSLLLLKSFVTPLQYVNAGGVSAGSALAANSSEMLSNRLNNALKGLSNFVDLGVNYNPGAQNSSQQVELTMSKQMFNNRLSIDGILGVNNNQTQNSSQIIGDVHIEYKLTESGKYVLKAFNRTNNNTQMTISGGPYTQGVGIGYKYEFDNLFRKREKRKKENK